ncbi:hypothetical protein R4317_29855, partial [Rhodococcus oxybenzonivorans]|uniref:hypothetical protein n=1 Tax=Rhodococcus oxybenzonivorans TaxID=1990687 RepID=UPI002955611B
SYLTWETADPEIWVAWGYAEVRVDSRGAAPGAPRRETERVASLPAREPLRGSQWVDSRCRRSSRFAPLSFRD